MVMAGRAEARYVDAESMKRRALGRLAAASMHS